MKGCIPTPPVKKTLPTRSNFDSTRISIWWLASTQALCGSLQCSPDFLAGFKKEGQEGGIILYHQIMDPPLWRKIMEGNRLTLIHLKTSFRKEVGITDRGWCFTICVNTLSQNMLYIAVMFSRTCVQGQGQGQEILKANTKDIQKPLPQRHTTMKNIPCSTRD